MWSFYGSKRKIVHKYPVPSYNKIIEPFAGSAQYSLFYFEHDIVLYEKYEVIYKLWRWLQQCSPSDILSLPKIQGGDNLDNFSFDCLEAKWLMGFMVQQGVSSPRKTASKVFGGGKIHETIEQNKKRIAGDLHKIKHWKIFLGSYENISNEQCTWFIDPPYQHGGEYYHSSVSNKHLDFKSLGDWCKSRLGQVMVCENSKADWMDFKYFSDLHGSKNRTKEVMWYREI